MVQNHLEISSKTQFWTRNVEIRPKVLRKVCVIFQDLSRRTHKGPYGPIRAHRDPQHALCIFGDFLSIFRIFGQILGFLIKITWFLSFSSKNDAESSRNFMKILFLDPKRAKLVQKSLRKVYGKYTESSKTSKTCPGKHIRAHKGPYEPLWAHIGPYGPLWVLLDRSWKIT